MPFAFHHSISTVANLWVWKIEESEEELDEETLRELDESTHATERVKYLGGAFIRQLKYGVIDDEKATASDEEE